MSEEKRVLPFPGPNALRFAQLVTIRETAIHSGGNPNIDYLLGVSKDGLVYRVNKNTQKWEKFGEDYAG